MDRRALFALTGAAVVAGLASPKVLAANPGLTPSLSNVDAALALPPLARAHCLQASRVPSWNSLVSRSE